MASLDSCLRGISASLHKITLGWCVLRVLATDTNSPGANLFATSVWLTLQAIMLCIMFTNSPGVNLDVQIVRLIGEIHGCISSNLVPDRFVHSEGCRVAVRYREVASVVGHLLGEFRHCERYDSRAVLAPPVLHGICASCTSDGERPHGCGTTPGKEEVENVWNTFSR